MRFCMVTTFYPPYHFGGDATYVRALSRALVERGHQVEVIHCLDAYALKEGYDDLPPEGSEVQDGIVVHHLRSSLRLLSPLVTQQTGHPGLKLTRLKQLLDRKFDVINFHNISLVGGPQVLKLGRAPVKLYTLHEYWLLCATHVFWKDGKKACDGLDCIRCSIKSGIPPQLWRYTAMPQEAITHVDAIISPSEYAAKRHLDAGFDAPIHCLPLFSTLHTSPALSDRAAQPTGRSANAKPRFLFVGRITAPKGILPLVEAFSKWPEFELDIVGDGELLDSLQQRYAHCDNIHFVGRVPQRSLIPYYQTTTALIFPSFMMETFGLTVVEAFACGTPVLARDAGGNRELIEKTGGGILYKTEAELKAALQRLADNPPLRRRLGELAYLGYQSYYTESIHVDAYLAQVQAIRAEKSADVPSPQEISTKGTLGEQIADQQASHALPCSTAQTNFKSA